MPPAETLKQIVIFGRFEDQWDCKWTECKVGIRKWEKPRRWKNAIKSRFLKNDQRQCSTPILQNWRHFFNFGGFNHFWHHYWHNFGEMQGGRDMRRKGYRGTGCTKRSFSKCEGVCRTFDKIQTAFADILQNDESVVSFQCNVLLESGEEKQYTTWWAFL